MSQISVEVIEVSNLIKIKLAEGLKGCSPGILLVFHKQNPFFLEKL